MRFGILVSCWGNPYQWNLAQYTTSSDEDLVESISTITATSYLIVKEQKSLNKIILLVQDTLIPSILKEFKDKEIHSYRELIELVEEGIKDKLNSPQHYVKYLPGKRDHC